MFCAEILQKQTWRKKSDVLAFCRCIRKPAKIDYYLCHVCLSICWSVLPFTWNNSAPIERIFKKINI